MSTVFGRVRWGPAGAGLIAGSVVGLAAYWVLRLPVVGLFLVFGALMGAVLSIVASRLVKMVKLKEIKVSVPQFGELLFTVSGEDAAVAWQLFVESATRVSAQPLPDEAGRIREAMDSLYSLFRTTREILMRARPSTIERENAAVEHLAIAMINNEIRPFLSLWHPRLRSWELEHPERPEVDWPLALPCRAELLAVQRRLVRYVVGLGKLAEVPNPRNIIIGTLDTKDEWATQERAGQQ